MTRPLLAATLALAAGCSSLEESGNGVVALRVILQSPAAVEPNDTLALQAQALDINGDVVSGVAIYWRTPDTAALDMVDSAGLVTAKLTSGTGRVQARTGSLFSELQTLTLRRASDSLALPGATADTVVTGDTASAPLEAAVLSLTPDTTGVGNTRITFTLLDTIPGVHFAGDLLSLSAVTAAPSGGPAQPVTLRRSSGAALGDVRVAADARRPSGTPVPGSGQIITITFQ